MPGARRGRDRKEVVVAIKELLLALGIFCIFIISRCYPTVREDVTTGGNC